MLQCRSEEGEHMDVVNRDTRSRMMRSVRSWHTAPEMIVRRAAHGLGYRYRLHCSHLPGRPDLVFASYKAAIFVNGCFWHQHSCPKGKIPTSNRAFWQKKLLRNVERDYQNCSALVQNGWKVLVVWECETKDPSRIHVLLQSFLVRPRE